MSTREYTVKEWQGMKLYAEPTLGQGRQRIDENGDVWEWTSANKRVEAKKVRFDND